MRAARGEKGEVTRGDGEEGGRGDYSKDAWGRSADLFMLFMSGLSEMGFR